jgi:tRNA pseudouridine38-40 synthase
MELKIYNQSEELKLTVSTSSSSTWNMELMTENAISVSFTHPFYVPLDVTRMQQAADYLVGEHDFKSFCSVNTVAETTVRTLYSVKVSKESDMITIRVTGSGFLYNMVRIIVGTLMEVGKGSMSPEQIPQILAALDRQKAGPTAPACGLTLYAYEFEKR